MKDAQEQTTADAIEDACTKAVHGVCRRRGCRWPHCAGSDHCDISIEVAQDRHPDLSDAIWRMTQAAQRAA